MSIIKEIQVDFYHPSPLRRPFRARGLTVLPMERSRINEFEVDSSPRSPLRGRSRATRPRQGAQVGNPKDGAEATAKAAGEHAQEEGEVSVSESKPPQLEYASS